MRYGAELLDRLMKVIMHIVFFYFYTSQSVVFQEVVSENPHFEVDNFILLLRDRMYTRNGYVRQFLVSWVCY